MENQIKANPTPQEGEIREYKDGKYIFENGHFHKIRPEGTITKENVPPKEGEVRKYTDGDYVFEGGHWKKQYSIKQILIKTFKENLKTEFDKKAVINWFSSKTSVQEIITNLSELVKEGVVRRVEKPVDLNKSIFRYVFNRESLVKEEPEDLELKNLFKDGDVISEEVTGEELK
jgi:hypothetical protein